MNNSFEVMVSANHLVDLGFKPYQAKQIIKECKEYLALIEGFTFFYNRQVSIVPARIVEKLYGIQITK